MRLRSFHFAALLACGVAVATLAGTAQAQKMVRYQTTQPVYATPAIATELPNNFQQLSPTVPNEELNFNDDSNNSCCTRIPGQQRAYYRIQKNDPSTNTRMAVTNIDASGPQILVECNKYANLPSVVANQIAPPTNVTVNRQLSVSPRRAFRVDDPNVLISNAKHRSARNTETGYFHVSSVSGNNRVAFTGVENYSVCMARGSNVLEVRDTDNGSLLSYEGADYVRMAGNNTNMLTRTGGGNDVIEIEQADPLPLSDQTGAAFRGEKWSANNVYRTAVSGREGVDTLVLANTPLGTKWCHIGDAHVFGETFHIVEFALSPSVVKGPRRQRISIASSMEYVIYNGRKFSLEQFLNNGYAEGELEIAQSQYGDGIAAVGYSDGDVHYRGTSAVKPGEYAGQPVAMPVVTTGTPVRGLF